MLKQDDWTTVRIRKSTLEKINKLIEKHKEFESAAEFVDQSVILRLERFLSDR
jgi:Arc/MetJ-type ribon-helix-helix transcriptional regulator